MNVIEEARRKRKLLEQLSQESEDKTLAIAFKEYFKPWERGEYKVGDIRLNANGIPKECMIDHDSTVNTEWTIDTASIWKAYHSRKKEYALPFEKPTGAHDMYLKGEYMIWTDEYTYLCNMDTTYSPSEYAQAWKLA